MPSQNRLAPAPGKANPPAKGKVAYGSYTVNSGESLTVIARRLGTDAQTLVSINRLKNPNLIHPGDKLKVPAKAAPPKLAAAEPTAKKTVRLIGPQLPTPGSGSVSSLEPFSTRADAKIGFNALYPSLQKIARKYKVDVKLLSAVVYQESTFTNWRVHPDGTGHGLVGLDDNGLLLDFERWACMKVGRGQLARTIPVAPQLEFLGMRMKQMVRKYGNSMAAARAWHRGAGGMWDALGDKYANLITNRINQLFTPSGARRLG